MPAASSGGAYSSEKGYKATGRPYSSEEERDKVYKLAEYAGLEFDQDTEPSPLERKAA